MSIVEVGSFHYLLRLWRFLPKSRKLQLLNLLSLSILSSFAEILSIGLMLPFLTILIDPYSAIVYLQKIEIFYQYNSVEVTILRLIVTIFFVIAIIFSTLIRLLLLMVQSRVSFNIGSDISETLYLNSLYEPYINSLNRNSADIISTILSKTKSISSYAVLPVLQIIGSFISIVVIISTLGFIEPLATILVVFFLALLYGVAMFATKPSLVKFGRVVNKSHSRVMQSLQEGFSSIRDIILSGTQKIYWKTYVLANNDWKNATIKINIISGLPRIIIEGLCLILMTIFFYSYMKSSNEFITAIPLFGATILAIQRLIPLLQQFFGGFSLIRSGYPSLIDVVELLEKDYPGNKVATNITQNIFFKNSIELNEISFRYSKETPYVFKNINLTILHGQYIGIIGPSGCGKSTLVDLIMGLLAPTEGTMKVDGRVITQELMPSWQCNIAHVPQSVYITDASLISNIAFGVPEAEIDVKKAFEVVEMVGLMQVISGLEDGIKTSLGERGARLSGGQRQRIGLARALYKNAKVLVLDEATNALDSNAEKVILDLLEKIKGKTTIIRISHSFSSLESCDHIFEYVDSKKYFNVRK